MDISLSYKDATTTSLTPFTDCKLTGTDFTKLTLRHSISGSNQVAMKRNSIITHSIQYKPSADLDGIKISSQQLISTSSDKEYPDVLEADDTTILFFTDGEQVLGTKILPKNLHLKYRSIKTVGADETTELIWDQTIGAITPVSSDPRAMYKIFLDFDFRQTVKTQEVYTLLESVLSIVVIVPLAFILLSVLLYMVNVVEFYRSLAKLIQRRYFHAIEWQAIQKFRTKFETI